MFAKISLLTLLALASPLFVRADVTPSEPGPGATYNAGTTCTVTWEGDKDSTALWKDMSIQLMTGSNFDMVHLTTVATNQDGTVNGRFTYPCPQVAPFSTIYFYQFTSTHTTIKTWTTRFTIASPTGQTVTPANPTQPGNNAPIPWGIGALADPSTANPPPTIGGAAGNTTSASSSASSSVSSTVASSSSRITTASRSQSSTASSSAASANAAQVHATNGASGSAVETRLLGAILTLGASVMALTVLL